MLSRAHVQAALQAKRADFAGYEQRTHQLREQYAQALAWYQRQAAPAVEAQLGALAEVSIAQPGARPTAERQAGRSAILPFGPRWNNHEEARAWALGVLEGVTTVAVDGSQITPSPDFSVPVGAVQVGWFANPHVADQPYVKDLAFEVLAPPDLAPDQDDAASAWGFPDLLVNLRRFELECEQLMRAMRRLAGEGARGVCFFDGSLAISFAAQLRPELRARYIEAVVALLNVSEETRVPLVGFVDSSYANDLTAMLGHLCALPGGRRYPDSALLREGMRWGDRSEALVCARDDRLFDELPAARYYQRLVFTYLKTTAENAPARLDLPLWVLEAGLLDWVTDVVRAECVVGTGYPYAVETADAVAVITMEDRERFYQLCQEFLAESGIALRYARKAQSKYVRR